MTITSQRTAFFELQHLPAHVLLPWLIPHLAECDAAALWSPCWLQNQGAPIIGLLPSVSWCVYPHESSSAHLSKDVTQDNYQIIKSQRPFHIHSNSNHEAQATDATDTSSCSSKYTLSRSTSLSAWCDELITYMNQQQHCASSQTEREYSVYQNTAHQNKKQNDNTYLDEYEYGDTAAHKCHEQYEHGLMGFIGYDMGAKALSPNADIHLAKQPCAYFGHYDMYLKPVRATSDIPDSTNTTEITIIGWQLIYNPSVSGAPTDAKADLEKETQASNTAQEYFDKLCGYLQQLDNKLNQQTYNELSARDGHTIAKAFLPSSPPALALHPIWTKTAYQQAFERTQAYLYAGDCYQINLTQPWIGNLPPSHTLVDYLPALHAQTNAPYAGYLALTPTLTQNHQATVKPVSKPSFELLSCSPELFVSFKKSGTHGQHTITAKPIKGTIARGITKTEDEMNKQTLATSDKDCAENVMIVDLLRNDLGKYAKTGSVRVPHLFAIESFSNVHHLVSTITAELKPSVHPLTALFGSLPAGSITGTPKKRAVEIIDELEACAHGQARGAYCGSMGFINFDGTGQFNVLIRTLQASVAPVADKAHEQARNVVLWAGGGITVASTAESEYQECWDKVGNLLTILRGKP